MFDTGKSKFYRKTKSLLKLLKIRVDAIKKKKFAVNKYLKNDVADLLRNGLETNAYGRAEGLLVEQNMSSCYDYIEQCILCIYSQLTNMQNQRECPNECREAVPFLMHAAARFADLPELRELRTIFTERYGNSLEPYINKEYVEKLRAGPASQERKFRLMQEVAQEYGIQWDSESFRQKLFKPQVPAQAPAQVPAQDKPMHGSYYDTAGDNGCNGRERNDDALTERDNTYNGNKQSDVRGYNVPTSYGRKDDPHGRYNLPPSSSEDKMVTNYRRDSTSQDSRQNCSSTIGNLSEDEVDGKKASLYGFIQPPYVKQTAAREGSTTGANGNVNAQNGQDPPAWKGNLKPPPGREVVANGRKNQKISPRLQSILNNDDGDQSDKEDKKLDQLLMLYSQKKAFQAPSRNANVYPPVQESDYGSDGSTSYRSARESFYPPPGQESDDSYGATRHRSARAENLYPPPGHENDDTSDVSSSHRSVRGNLYPPPGQESDDPHGTAKHKGVRANPSPPLGQERDANYRTNPYPPPGRESDDAYGAARHRSARTDVYPPERQSDDIYGARTAKTNVYPPPVQESDDPYGGTRHRSARTNVYPPSRQENDDVYGVTRDGSARTNLYLPPGQQDDDTYGATASHWSGRTNLYPPPGQENEDAYGAARHRSAGTNLYPPLGQQSDDAYGAGSQRSARTNLYPPPWQESEDTRGGTWRRSSRTQYPPPGQESHDGYGAAWHRSSRANAYPPPGQQSDDTGGARHRSSNSEPPVTPGRATSFQPTAPYEPTALYEETKRHSRANSLQEISGGHVHPKLPNYEDVAARLGALKSR